MLLGLAPRLPGKEPSRRPFFLNARRAALPAAVPAARRPVARILVSEDDHDIQQLYGALLPAHGFELISTPGGDGPRTIAMALRARPHLLITDSNKPGLDGHALAAALRAHPRTARIAVLMVTAMDARSEPGRVRHAAIDDYLVKPFPLEGLLYRVAALLPLDSSGHDELAARALGLACYEHYHPVTGLPSLHQLAAALPAHTAGASWAALRVGLPAFAALVRAYGRPAADGMLARLAGIVRRAAAPELLVGHLGFDPTLALVGPATLVDAAAAAIIAGFAGIRVPPAVRPDALRPRLAMRRVDQWAGSRLSLPALRAAWR